MAYLQMFLKIASALSLSMCFFDGNHKILLLKAEMAQPDDFMKVVSISHAVFAAIVIAFGASVHMILADKSDLFMVLNSQPDQPLLVAIKFLMLAACFLWFLLTAQDLHSTSQKVLIMATSATGREGNLN